MGRIGFVTALAALLAPLAGGCGGGGPAGPPLERVELVEAHMGTEFRVVVYADHPALGLAAASHALDRVRALDDALSDYDPESELSRLSATAGSGRAVPCSDDLWRVLVAAQGFAEATDGAFDVTVGAVVRQWRRAARQARRTPS